MNMRGLLASMTLVNVQVVRSLRAPVVGARPFSSSSEISRAKRARMVAASPTESRFITGEEGNNVTPYITNLVGRNLHQLPDHPLGIIKAKIEAYFNSLDGPSFEVVDNLDPLVNAQECFDDLLIPPDHPGRKPSDTYYVSRLGGREVSSPADTLLRTHTSAHQSTLMRAGKEAFLCTGDVYRRDEIDASHFPVFHQMEGVKVRGECFDRRSPSAHCLHVHREARLSATFTSVVSARYRLPVAALRPGHGWRRNDTRGMARIAWLQANRR